VNLRGFDRGDAAFDRLLHLVEGAPLDLAHALARDPVLVGELLERDSRSFNTVSASPSALPRLPTPSLSAVADPLAFGEPGLLADAVVEQPILPVAGIAFLADRGVERHVAAQPPVHVDHVLLGHAQPLGDELDLIRTQVALFERGNLALGLAQVEEELFLVGGGAHLYQRSRAQDVFLDRGLDPPHRIDGQAKALVRLEAFDSIPMAG
jgi:hypothetical protein